MNIFLVRHGQDKDNEVGILNGHRDQELTQKGREQAKIVGEKLKDNAIDVIYASPLKRTMETAQIIANELGIVDVQPYPDLIERDFGVLTGRPLSDIPKLATKTLQSDQVLYFLEAEDSEDFPTLLERAKKVLADIQKKHPTENVLLVSHGDTGKMIRAAYHGWDFEKGLLTPYLDNTGVIELAPGSDIKE